jgi:hypothetical protein
MDLQKRWGGLITSRLFGVQSQDIDMAEETWAFFRTKTRLKTKTRP